jgi:hypothetical protein
VYVTEYFDPTRDDDGDFCGRDGDARDSTEEILGGVWADEAEWAATTVLSRLNYEVKSAADRFGWNYVDGISTEFRTHGYCAPDHWIVKFRESRANQHDRFGTMHPNRLGQTVYARRLESVLRRDLLTPSPLPPRP